MLLVEAEVVQLALEARKLARPEELGKLEISISPRVRPSEEAFQAFEDLGINRLVLLQVGKNEAELVQFVEDIAERYIK